MSLRQFKRGGFSKNDINFKSWLYADTLEKPEELLLYRGRPDGGLGVHHIKSKATAVLIKSFLETANGDKFLRNNYHHALFQWHVLNDTSIENPGLPHYYSKDFFSLIQFVNEQADLNLKRMTASHWYKVLLEKNITTEVKLNGKNENRTAKIEMKFPQIEWTRTWEYMRTRGLEGEQTSFLLKVLYNILPTRERLHRMRFEESPLCKLCNANAEDSLEHLTLSAASTL